MGTPPTTQNSPDWGHVCRVSMTQIMNLLSLAPEIQVAILFLPRVEQGGDPVTERELREVVGLEDWEGQVASF